MEAVKNGRNRLRQLSQWSRAHWQRWVRKGTSAGSALRRSRSSGGKLADVSDLLRPEFGACFTDRFPGGADSLSPRKRWELCWLAQKFQELKLDDSKATLLGLGVGTEPLMYHFAHSARQVVATDLYNSESVWRESRSATETVASLSPFSYPRERLTVRDMDMRDIEFPADCFDVVWSCSSIEHMATLPELVHVFREIHRVLKPGGVALITTEFSLGERYFLPGVLSLWDKCALFGRSLQGLTLSGPVDLHYNQAAPGNGATRRCDAHRLARLADLSGGPSGLCIHVGYTRLIPVAFALEKTSEHFDWPDLLDAPAWYRPFAEGVDELERQGAGGPGRHLLPQGPGQSRHPRATPALLPLPDRGTGARRPGCPTTKDPSRSTRGGLRAPR